MLRTIGAVIAGYVAIGILVVCTDLIFTLAVPGFQTMKTPPAYYFVASLLTDTLYTVGGGALCAAIAKARAHQATIGLIVMGELIGLASSIKFWGIQPHYYAITLMIVYPPAIWLGSRAWARRGRA